MNAVTDRFSAQLELAFAPDADGCTRVVQRRVRYPYTFLKPFWFDDRPRGIATVLLQSGSGGLFGGEQLAQQVRLEPGAAVHVTTQAATIVHAARGYPATIQNVRLQVSRDAFLEYLPEPLILFPGARLQQHIVAELDTCATLVIADGYMSHDPDGNDTPFDNYSNNLEVISPQGRLLFADRVAVAGSDFARSLRIDNVPWRATGLFVVAAPHLHTRHAEITAALQLAMDAIAASRREALYAAAAALPNSAGVVCRIAARRGEDLRAALAVCSQHARILLTGSPPPRRRK